MKRDRDRRARVNDRTKAGLGQRSRTEASEGQGRGRGRGRSNHQQEQPTPDERTSIALLAVAGKQARRAANSFRSGKRTGPGKGWRSLFEVTETSEDDARQAAVLSCVQELTRIYGDAWSVRVPWLPPFGPGNRRQVAFLRWISLVAWRSAYRELAALPGGVTGRRETGVYSLRIDIEQDEALKAMHLAQPSADPDYLDSGDRARELRRAKRIVWSRFLDPFKGKRQLGANERRAKLAAIRRARIVCQLIDGQGAQLRSDKLGEILKPLGIKTGQGKRSLAGALAKLA